MSEKPINDEHVAFARALVALAREHGANNLEVKFQLTGGRRFFEQQSNYTGLRFNWSEGRHGVPSRFALYAEAYISLPEKAEEPKP